MILRARGFSGGRVVPDVAAIGDSLTGWEWWRVNGGGWWVLWPCILKCRISIFTSVLIFYILHSTSHFYIILHTHSTAIFNISVRNDSSPPFMWVIDAERNTCVCICCANDDVDLCPTFADNVQTFFVLLLLPLLVTGSLWGSPLRRTPPPPRLRALIYMS